MKGDRDDAGQRPEPDSAHHKHGHEDQRHGPDKGQQRAHRAEHHARDHGLGGEDGQRDRQDHSAEGTEDRYSQRFRAALPDLGHHCRIGREHPPEKVSDPRTGRNETRQLDIGRGEGPEDRAGDQGAGNEPAKPAKLHQDTALRLRPGNGSTSR